MPYQVEHPTPTYAIILIVVGSVVGAVLLTFFMFKAYKMLKLRYKLNNRLKTDGNVQYNVTDKVKLHATDYSS